MPDTKFLSIFSLFLAENNRSSIAEVGWAFCNTALLFETVLSSWYSLLLLLNQSGIIVFRGELGLKSGYRGTAYFSITPKLLSVAFENLSVAARVRF